VEDEWACELRGGALDSYCEGALASMAAAAEAVETLGCPMTARAQAGKGHQLLSQQSGWCAGGGREDGGRERAD
jgi:hypothetical protein